MSPQLNAYEHGSGSSGDESAVDSESPVAGLGRRARRKTEHGQPVTRRSSVRTSGAEQEQVAPGPHGASEVSGARAKEGVCGEGMHDGGVGLGLCLPADLTGQSVALPNEAAAGPAGGDEAGNAREHGARRLKTSSSPRLAPDARRLSTATTSTSMTASSSGSSQSHGSLSPRRPSRASLSQRWSAVSGASTAPTSHEGNADEDKRSPEPLLDFSAASLAFPLPPSHQASVRRYRSASGLSSASIGAASSSRSSLFPASPPPTGPLPPLPAMATPSHRDAPRSTKSHSSSSGSGTFRPFDPSTGSDAASFTSTAPSTLLPTYAYARADPPPLPLEQGFIPPPLDLDDEEKLILGALPIFARGAGTAMAEYGWTRAEEELECRGGSERRDKCSLGRSTPGLERPMSPASVLLAPIPRPAVPVPRLEQGLPSVPVDPSRSSKRASVFATLAAPFAVLSRSRSTGGLTVPVASDDTRRVHRLSMIGEMDSSSPSPTSSISRSSSSASGQESRLRTRSTLFGTLTSRPLSRVIDPPLSASTSAASPAALIHSSPPAIPHVRFARTPPELAALSCGAPIAEDEVSEKAARLLGLPFSSSPSSPAPPIPTAAPSPPPVLHGTGPTEAQRRYARASRRAAALLGLRGTASFGAQEVEVADRKQGAWVPHWAEEVAAQDWEARERAEALQREAAKAMRTGSALAGSAVGRARSSAAEALRPEAQEWATMDDSAYHAEHSERPSAGHSFFDADSSDDESPVVRGSSRLLPLSAATSASTETDEPDYHVPHRAPVPQTALFSPRPFETQLSYRRPLHASRSTSTLHAAPALPPKSALPPLPRTPDLGQLEAELRSSSAFSGS